MDWNDLLKLERLNDPGYVQKKHRPTYVQDIDRILFSQPFRRLANKTQVHPLYENDHIHHRLIHSLEVATVGRSLGAEVGAWLADELHVITSDQVEVVAGIVQTACMAHDIGNPPFGHSGEEAVGSWFQDKFVCPKGVLEDISQDQRHEFEAFEGNAQGFRILTRTEMYRDDGGMRLALGSLGAFTKYPVSASARRHVGAEGVFKGTKYIGLKKYGFFDSDIAIFDTVAAELGLPKAETTATDGTVIGHWWRRHPLCFLMEAADDICYNVVDLEDAYLAGDITYELVKSLLEGLIPKSNRAYQQQGEVNTISRYRALAIGGTIEACVDAFKNSYAEIMMGEFPISLIDASGKAAEFKSIRDVAEARIFNAARKTELEVYGRNVVYRTLDGLLPLLNEVRQRGWDLSRMSSYHVQLVRALGFPKDGMTNSYDALHSLTDFVSGMTDRYAVKIADMIGR